MKKLFRVLTTLGLGALMSATANASEGLYYSQALTLTALDFMPPLPAGLREITCAPAQAASAVSTYTCDITMGDREGRSAAVSHNVADDLPALLTDKAAAAGLRFRILPNEEGSRHSYTVDIAVNRDKLALSDAVAFLKAFRADLPSWIGQARTDWEHTPARHAQDLKDLATSNRQSWGND